MSGGDDATVFDLGAVGRGLERIAAALGRPAPEDEDAPSDPSASSAATDPAVGEYEDLKGSDPDRVIPEGYRPPPPPPAPLRPELNHLAPVTVESLKRNITPNRPSRADVAHISKVAAVLAGRFAAGGFQRVTVTPHRDGHVTAVFYGDGGGGATKKETVPSRRRTTGGGFEPVECLVARICTLIYALTVRSGREAVPLQMHDPSRERSETQRETLRALQDFLRDRRGVV